MQSLQAKFNGSGSFYNFGDARERFFLCNQVDSSGCWVQCDLHGFALECISFRAIEFNLSESYGRPNARLRFKGQWIFQGKQLSDYLQACDGSCPALFNHSDTSDGGNMRILNPGIFIALVHLIWLLEGTGQL